MTDGLSFVVCTYNGRERVNRFIVPLLRVLGELPFACELIVVDDGSSDGTPDAVRALRDDVHLVELARNRGPSIARNHGIMAARHEWLMICDDDVEVDAATITALWRRRQLGICLVPELRDVSGGLQNAITSAWRRCDLKLEVHTEPTIELAYPVSACMFVNAGELRAAGGFDERFHIYFEDCDAGFALRRRGVKIRMAVGLAVTHHEHGAGVMTADRLRRISRSVYEGRWRFAMRALTGRRRAVVLALGLPRTLGESLRKRDLDPVRGYVAAMRDLRLMLEPRSRHDLSARS